MPLFMKKCLNLYYEFYRMLKKFFKSFDMFTSIPSLRVQGESSHASVFAGLLSLIILLLFGYVFVRQSIDLLEHKSISYSESTLRYKRNSSNPVNDLKFAFGLRYFDIFERQSDITITAFIETMTNNVLNSVEIELVECTKDMWEELGEDRDKLFDQYLIEQLACPKDPSVLELYGIKNQASYRMIKFYLTVCNQTYSDVTCANQSDVNNYIYSIVMEEKYIEGVFIYMNTGFNPSEKESTIKFIDDTIWITFTDIAGTEAFVNIGTYSVTTDVSFSPLTQDETENGTYLSNFMSATFERGNTGIFAMVEISLSANHKEIKRKYGKIDEILSYIGGLFGIFMSFLGIFFIYEMLVGEGVFSVKDGNKVKQRDFHILKYFKYAIFDWIKTLFCCQPQWHDCQMIEETREEANEQIDVQLLLKRIQHLEKIAATTVSLDQNMSLYVTEPQSISEAKMKRRRIQYFEKINQQRVPLTLKNLSIISVMAKMGLSGPSLHEDKTDTSDSITKIHEALKTYEHYIEEEEKEIVELLDEEDLLVEKQIAEAFYRLPESYRSQIYESIPLTILKRLKEAHENDGPSKIFTDSPLESPEGSLSMFSFLKFSKSVQEPDESKILSKKNKVKNQFKVEEI